MLTKLAIGVAIGGLMASSALAEVYDVQMINRGEAGNMVFEPGFLRIAAGDSLRFIATDRGHNAEVIDGMLPEGAEAFAGAINEEYEVVIDVEGLYAVKCLPHYAMGMVLTVAVGDDVAIPDDFLEGRIPPRALERFNDQLGGL